MTSITENCWILRNIRDRAHIWIFPAEMKVIVARSIENDNVVQSFAPAIYNLSNDVYVFLFKKHFVISFTWDNVIIMGRTNNSILKHICRQASRDFFHNIKSFFPECEDIFYVHWVSDKQMFFEIFHLFHTIELIYSKDFKTMPRYWHNIIVNGLNLF